MTAALAANRQLRTVNRKLRALVGWSTGLEPATAGTTIQGSTIELRPPFPKGVLEYLNFGVRQADFALRSFTLGFSAGYVNLPSFVPISNVRLGFVE